MAIANGAAPVVTDPALTVEVLAGLKKAAKFFAEEVATEGGYVYQYSADLQRREGELPASATTIWVQPPGTPTVGLALLHAWEATGDEFYLAAAQRAGQSLVRGQLLSGGWDYEINFDPADRARKAYRVAPNNSQGMNVATLDDNTTQEALRFLMRLDRALAAHGKPTSAIREAVDFCLASLLAAEYPNGAWPQRYSQPPDAEKFPILPASYPKTWDREWPGTQNKYKYTGHYTFNDNAQNDVIEALLEAGRLYEEPKFTAAAEKGGDFIIQAQMPEPQPAWAQQYDAEMHPAWARKFEPPAVTGGESVSVLRTLLTLYRETGKAKYLEPIPPALAYLQASRMPDGQLARFYELQTNKPLYVTRDYQLTYSDADMPTHYSFKMNSDGLDRIRRDYERLRATPPEQLGQRGPSKPSSPTKETISRAKAALASLDDRGRWLDKGRLKMPAGPSAEEPIIRCATFAKNVNAFCDYLIAAQASGGTK